MHLMLCAPCSPEATSRSPETTCLSPEAACLSLAELLLKLRCKTTLLSKHRYTVAYDRGIQAHQADDAAPWRQTNSRLTTQQFLKRQLETGRRISPIFAVFGVGIHLFRIDWLHCADQGVAADLAGNVFETLLHKLPGANQEQRCHSLNAKLQAYYDRIGVEDRIRSFDLKTFKRPKKSVSAKLKGSAAEVRCIVGFLKEIADEVGDPSDPRHTAIQNACKHLSHCYQALAKSSAACRDEALYSSSQAFALQYHALHLTGDGVSFRCKPKFHMFLELCSQPGVLPFAFWCYRDEDFGGPIARQSKMVGPWKNLTAYSRHAFDMFFMKNKVPRLVEVTC
jgi:hypothetical protein